VPDAQDEARAHCTGPRAASSKPKARYHPNLCGGQGARVPIGFPDLMAVRVAMIQAADSRPVVGEGKRLDGRGKQPLEY
jgi:hypothetical protein